MKALEKLINDYERKIEKLEKSSNIDYENNNMPLSAAKQMTAEYLKTAVSDIKRAMAADTGEKQCNLPVVMPSTLPEPQQWFMEKFDVTASRMNLIEHKGNDVVRFIHEYLDDLP